MRSRANVLHFFTECQMEQSVVAIRVVRIRVNLTICLILGGITYSTYYFPCPAHTNNRIVGMI